MGIGEFNSYPKYLTRLNFSIYFVACRVRLANLAERR